MLLLLLPLSVPLRLLQGLKVIDFQQPDYMHTLENAIQMGLPVILQNVQEKIDPSLDPVLNKSLVKVGEPVVRCVCFPASCHGCCCFSCCCHWCLCVTQPVAH